MTPHYISSATVRSLPASRWCAAGYWIESQQLADVPEAAMLAARAAAVVNAQIQSSRGIATVEPIYDDAEQELKGYLAFPQQ